MKSSGKFWLAGWLALAPWQVAQYAAGAAAWLGPAVAFAGFLASWRMMSAEKRVLKDQVFSEQEQHRARTVMLINWAGMLVSWIALGTQPSFNPMGGVELYLTQAVGIGGALILIWQGGYLVGLLMGRVKLNKV